MVKLPKLIEALKPYLTAGQLHIVNVYIREAHPRDGWSLDFNDATLKVCPRQTHDIESRLEVANNFQSAMDGVAAEIPLIVDDPDTNALDKAYEAPPERLVVIHQGRVCYFSGQGPFQYSIDSLKQFLTQFSC